MKKVFSLILILVLLLSFAVPTIAADEERSIMDGWFAALGKVSVKESTEGGEKVVAFSNIGASYHSAGVELMPSLKELIAGKDSITLNFSLDVKIEYAEDCEGDDITLGMLIRAEGIIERLKDTDAFKEFCDGKTSIKVISDTNYGVRVIKETDVYEDWETLEGEITLSPNDINAGLWSSLRLCFDNIKPYESVKSIFTKNARITVIDEKEGKGEVTIDMEGLLKEPEADPNLKFQEGDTPALPEGNKLIAGTEWSKYAGLGSVNVEKLDQNGVPVWSITNIKSEFATPVLNIYPTVKELIGDKDEITVWIVLDVRVLSLTEDEQPFGMKIRVSAPSEAFKDQDIFKSNYSGTAFKHAGGSMGIYAALFSDGVYQAKWQRIQIEKTFTKEDFVSDMGTTWNLCFDQMKQCRYIQEMQIKGVGIYLYDDYEPIIVEDENEGGEGSVTGTPAPPVIYNPIGFDKYGVTFTEGIDTKLPDGIVADSNGSNGGQNNGSQLTLIIIIAAAAVVVGGGAITTIIIIKNKKAVKEEK